jgi:GNAT superfamily N-acetyltransferase
MNAVQSVTGASDPLFVFARAGRLDCPPGLDVQDAWRHFSMQVARDPLDIEAHARRVLLASRPPLTDRAFGALVDLFLALGDRGRGLRRQLLEQALPWLDPDDAHFLRSHLDTSLPRGAQLPTQRWSVLDTAVLGSLNMVGLQRREVAQETPFQQAMSLLEYGDLSGARGMLEVALLEEPGHEEVCRELLAIYQHSRDDTGKAEMADKLVARHGALPSGWF